MSDPREAILQKARSYADIEEGQSCSQTSFKVKTKAFLYIGEQGGRYKAMFKLKGSLAEAEALAQEQPSNYEVGKFGWVTTRFSAEEAMPDERWQTWLDESYQLAAPKPKKRAAKKK